MTPLCRRVATTAMTLFLLVAPRSAHPNEGPVVFSVMPTYSWDSVPGATSYFLWGGDEEKAIVGGWFSATQLGCSSDEVCAAKPAQALTAGEWQWWVKARNASEEGPWSEGASFTASAPAIPALVAPSGTITTRTPTYRWSSAEGAAWYEVWVGTATSVAFNQAYAASSLGCPSAHQTCTLTTTLALANGTRTWFVRGWSPLGYGLWSSGKTFTLSLAPATR